MPLLGATGAVADHICAVCGLERHFTTGDWLTTDDAPDMIGTPPCPGCTSQEWFSWHDWTYESARTEGTGEQRHQVRFMDPDHFGAGRWS